MLNAALRTRRISTPGIKHSDSSMQKGAGVELDEELCLCFHVTKRKVLNYLRVERPARAGQLSDCFGAGTGCGWCRTYLCRLFEEAHIGTDLEPVIGVPEPSSAEYAQARARYIRAGGGTPPPGATPPGVA